MGSDQSSVVKLFYYFTPVKTATIEDVITIYYTFALKAASNTKEVPLTAGIMISFSFLGILLGKGEAVCIT